MPQKPHDEIEALEAELGQEFMGFFKQTKLREEQLAKLDKERRELEAKHKAEKKPGNTTIITATTRFPYSVSQTGRWGYLRLRTLHTFHSMEG